LPLKNRLLGNRQNGDGIEPVRWVLLIETLIDVPIKAFHSFLLFI